MRNVQFGQLGAFRTGLQP